MGAYSVKPLIPRHIPASFPGPLRPSRFPFLRERHGSTVKVLPYNPIRDGSVLCETVDSKAHSGFVLGPITRPGPSGPWRFKRNDTLVPEPLALVLRQVGPRRIHGKPGHVCATRPIRDRSVLCETVDSRTHSGFVPRAFTALRFPILWEAPREHRKGVLPYNPIRDGSILCETVDSRTHSGFVPGPFRQLANPKPAGRPPAERRRTAQADSFSERDSSLRLE